MKEQPVIAEFVGGPLDGRIEALHQDTLEHRIAVLHRGPMTERSDYMAVSYPDIREGRYTARLLPVAGTVTPFEWQGESV